MVYIEVLPSCFVSISGGLSADDGSRYIFMGLSGSKVLYMSFFSQYLETHSHKNLYENLMCFLATYIWPVDLYQKVDLHTVIKSIKSTSANCLSSLSSFSSSNSGMSSNWDLWLFWYHSLDCSVS